MALEIDSGVPEQPWDCPTCHATGNTARRCEQCHALIPAEKARGINATSPTWGAVDADFTRREREHRHRAVERVLELLGGLLGIALGLVFLSTSLGAVREYCLDTKATAASHSIVVEKHWTYVLWPPFFFASNDPPGRCVRNSPLREGLSAVGIWKLPSPEEQVRRHIASQLKDGAAGGSSSSGQQSDNRQRDVAYVGAVSRIMAPFSRPAANPPDYAAATQKVRTAVRQLESLAPPPVFAKSRADLLAGLRNEAALGPQLEHASSRHDEVTLNKLEQKGVAAGQLVQRAARETLNNLNGCQAASWKTC
jgi:hypothetical protein